MYVDMVKCAYGAAYGARPLRSEQTTKKQRVNSGSRTHASKCHALRRLTVGQAQEIVDTSEKTRQA